MRSGTAFFAVSHNVRAHSAATASRPRAAWSRYRSAKVAAISRPDVVAEGARIGAEEDRVEAARGHGER